MAHFAHNIDNPLDFDIDVDELTEDHPRAPNPVGININLKPHQQTLLARCIEYENNSIKLNQFNELSPHVDMNDDFKTSMAILGDRVGAGKSYVILSLIASNDITDKTDIRIKSYGYNKVVYYIRNKETSIKTNLLVVPHNLAAQWEYYIKTFGGSMKYKVIKTQKALDGLMNEARNTSEEDEDEDSNDGDGENEHHVHEEGNKTYVSLNVNALNLASTSNASNASSSTSHKMTTRSLVRTTVPRTKSPIDVIGAYDLIVVTSTLYNKLASFLNIFKIKLQRAIYDEVDNLNVPGCKEVQANFFWFVTASYGNVIYPKGQNKYEPAIGRYVWYANGIKHSGFLKNILMDLYYNVSRNLMKVLVVKNRESYVETSLSLPEMISHYIQCKTPYTINVLNGLVDRTILNYLNADDVQGALQYVNASHKSTEDNIITRVIDKYTRQATNINLQINTAREYLYDTEAERTEALTRLQKQLEQVQKKINAITERIKNNDLCTICYETVDKKTVTSCCQNTFCFKCINLWLAQKKVCPLCKIPLNITQLYVIDNDIVENNELVITDDIEHIDMTKPHTNNDKYQNLELILNNMDGNAKLLIFSAYENSFTNVIPILQRLNIKSDYLKGNGFQIQATIDRYKNGDVKVLLVNTRQYGSGLNLENTTDIILFHKFDTEIEKQVIGRAQRFGRKQQLNVHYLLYENEMPSIAT
jgi:SNF2 family DNA or RNA helicase